MRQQNFGPIILEEIQLVEEMVRLYYRKQSDSFVTEDRMLNYARARLRFCPFGEAKTTCQRCPVHCYQSNYQKQMKKIMRYSGPRMLLKHPVLTFRHGYRGLTRRIEK